VRLKASPPLASRPPRRTVQLASPNARLTVKADTHPY
jgi:hypothetical protein